MTDYEATLADCDKYQIYLCLIFGFAWNLEKRKLLCNMSLLNFPKGPTTSTYHSSVTGSQQILGVIGNKSLWTGQNTKEGNNVQYLLSPVGWINGIREELTTNSPKRESSTSLCLCCCYFTSWPPPQLFSWQHIWQMSNNESPDRAQNRLLLKHHRSYSSRSTYQATHTRHSASSPLIFFVVVCLFF